MRNKLFLIVFILIIFNENLIFSKSITLLSQDSIESIFEEDSLESLVIYEKSLEGVKSGKLLSVNHLAFVNCKVDLNSFLSLFEKSNLRSIELNECLVTGEIIDLIGTHDLKLRINSSIGSFVFKDLSPINEFVFIGSSNIRIDLNQFSKSLKVLILEDISSDRIENITSIKKLTNLERLNLHFNNRCKELITLNKLRKLKSISVVNFYYLPILTYLEDLQSIQISRIYYINSDSVNQLISSNKMINELYIRNCNLEKIPDSITNLKQLELLSLSDNKIRIFDTSLLKLPNLRTVFLDDNYISDFDSKNLINTNLNQLNIEFNNLKNRIKLPVGNKIIINQEGNPFID